MCPSEDLSKDNVEFDEEAVEEVLEESLDDELLSESPEEFDIEQETNDFSDELAFPSFQHGKNMAKAMDATQIYLSEIGFSPLLSAEEEVHYSKLALKGDMAARKKMIESN